VLPPGDATPDGRVDARDQPRRPFLLSTLLVPRLAQSDDARVAWFCRAAYKRLEVSQLATPEGLTAWRLRTDKACRGRAEQLMALTTPTCLSPGSPCSWADTPGAKTSLPRFRFLTQWILRTPEEGADTIIWLAACRRVKGQNGLFWFDRRAVSPHMSERTRESATERAALWHALHRWAGETPLTRT
jgi:hypothetical protein